MWINIDTGLDLYICVSGYKPIMYHDILFFVYGSSGKIRNNAGEIDR
jgi:hypothetical protein